MPSLKFKNPDTGEWEVMGYGGDMYADTYDPQGKAQDIFQYADNVVSDWAKAETKPTYTASEVGAAPAGYGLGDIHGRDIPKNTDTGNRDLNLATSIGWYFLYKSYTYDNSPVTQLPYSIMRVERYRYTVQTVYLCFNGRVDVVRRESHPDDTTQWYEWEYVNPPMALGKEYRTTERYLGKPMYVKLVDCGAGPNATQKSVTHGVENFGMIVDAFGSLVSGTKWEVHSDYATVYRSLGINTHSIYLTANTDMSAEQVYVKMKYTKSTD